MFIQETYDDVTRNLRRPFKILIGIPVTSLLMVLFLCLVPIAGGFYLIHKPLDLITRMVSTFFNIIFRDVKRCKECHQWETFDRHGNKKCKCDIQSRSYRG